MSSVGNAKNEKLGHSDEATGTAMEMQSKTTQRKCYEVLSIGSAQSRQAEQRNCEAMCREGIAKNSYGKAERSTERQRLSLEMRRHEMRRHSNE